MRKAPAILSLFLFLAFGSCTGERRLEFDGFELSSNPAETPRSIPDEFLYPNAKQIYSGEYTRNPYRSTREGALMLESVDSMDLIQAFYLLRLQEGGWQIIQSRDEGGEVLVMAENLSRRLFTVVLRGEDPVRIKLYIKTAGLR